MSSAATRIPSLDGIRAASLMLVFASHAGFAREAIGGLAVDAFFFLSGYLITTLLRLEYAANGSIAIPAFWMRRALRVLPPLYVAGLVATLITLALYPPGTVHTPTLIAQLLLYFNYYSLYGIHRGSPGFGVVWSLAVEEHFYLLFPLLYAALQKWLPDKRHQAWCLLGICIAVLAWRWILVFGLHQDITRIYPTTDTRIDSIVFGCILGVWSNPYIDVRSRTAPGPPSRRWKYLYLPAAAVTLLCCTRIDEPTFRNVFSFSIQGLALATLFTAAIRFPDWPPFRILNWRPAVHVGTLSYSLYLIHDVMLQAAAQIWPHAHAWQRAAAALAASFVFAYVVYVAVEKPCATQRWKLAVTDRYIRSWIWPGRADDEHASAIRP